MDEFDPTTDPGPAIDKDPAEMTVEERLIAARHALYESSRLLVGANAAIGYLAELVGVPSEEVRSISDRAELDEFREIDMAEEDEDDLDDDPPAKEYDVAESYEQAATAGHDPAADADAIWGE